MNPPVPIVAPLENRSRPTSSASDVSSITWSSVTPCALMRLGSTSTWYCSRCSPQIATLATPGTRSSRARIFQ